MALPNLKLLVPAIGPIRTSVRHRPSPTCARQIAGSAPVCGRLFSSTSVEREEEVRQRRYGTAKQPPPHVVAARVVASVAKGKEKDGGGEGKKEENEAEKVVESEVAVQEVKEGEARKVEPTVLGVEEAKEAKGSAGASTEQDGKKTVPKSPTPETPAPAEEASPADVEAAAPASSTSLNVLPANPMQTVLRMPAPGSEEHEDEKPPHLQAPPYVHHFDTWSLVKDLEKGGFESCQATSIMKAVRGLLSSNMELARRGLVSRSNVENETYLFRAACSELKTEVGNSRRLESEQMRAQRAQLQHEVDILSQRVGMEGQALKDELKGMFDDRKMTVRMEQRNMDSGIQELNYKIQVVLNSDSRSEVESIRWVLTRRAASALVITVVMVLGALNYSRYMSTSQEKERKHHKKAMEMDTLSLSPQDGSGTYDNGHVGFGGQAASVSGGDDALVVGQGVVLG